MPIPAYQEVMLPLLQYASERNTVKLREAYKDLAIHFDLTEAERNKLLDSGRQAVFHNRVGWAKTYLVKANLLESTRRGLFCITERGLNVLRSNPSHINIHFLQQFDEFVAFRERGQSQDDSATKTSTQDEQQTPEEIIFNTYKKLRKSLADELLEAIVVLHPSKFEILVLDLLLAMGYGSSLDSGEHLGQANDGGIDGVVREDKLGLDNIYIQAKRYQIDNHIGRPAIQAFVGSLMGLGASKGVFMTTSYFSQQAIDYAKNMNNMKVILIDGQQLATLMIEHNVGVSVKETYYIKQIDENYFPDD
ncbi:MAG: restriction endonuclease [Anaerolineae bacterium]